MKQYLDLLEDVMTNGKSKGDRTGTGTRAVFSRDLRINLKEGFPLLTTKRMWTEKGGSWKAIVHELLWFLQGATNIQYLKDNGVTIWDEWADENGDLGPVYGSQWRTWETNEVEVTGQTTEGPFVNTSTARKKIDQIAWLINEIKRNPDSRRLLVSAWNPADVPKMKLPPCHFAFQFVVMDGVLNCKFFMRSTDVFLGLPFNIASYALLTHMIAHQCDLEVGELVYSGTDVHIYNNHVEQVQLQLQRPPLVHSELRIKRRPESIFDYKYDDFEIVGYEGWPAIKAPVAI